MKKYLLALLLLPTICFAQVKTEVNLGLDPVTGESGYQNKDTFRTIYFQGPGLAVSGDTVYSSNGGAWSLNPANGKAYFLGYAGVGTINPRSRFEVQTNYNTVSGIDSLGMIISQSNAATSTTYPASAPLTWYTNVWNTTTVASQKAGMRMFTIGASGAGGGTPSFHLQYSKDTIDSHYADLISTLGTSVAFVSTISATSGIFSQTVTATQGVNANGFNIFNNSLNPGQTMVGKSAYTYPTEPSAIAAFYGVNNYQGVLIPTLTQSQMDSMGYTVASIAVTGGSGYTTAPTATVSAAGSPPVPNGPQSWGGNFFQGTATVSGGALTGISITHGGYWNGQVKVVLTGGGGTGATATATMARILPEGLIAYNTTIHAFQTWTGSKWSTGSYISKTSTLASGTVTVSEPTCLSTSRIIVSYNTPSGTQGFLSVPQSTVSAGTFVINSSSALDNSTVNWIVTN